MSEQSKKYVALIEELYPPDSRFPETATLGKEFMVWALQRFIDRMGGWKKLDESILKDMAYYCERHEKMTQNLVDKPNNT